MKLFQAHIIGIVAILSAFSCRPHNHDDPAPAAPAQRKPLSQINFQGKLTFPGSVPASNQTFDLSATLGGHDLMKGSNCENLDWHVSAQSLKTITTDGGGRFDVSFPLTDFAAVVDSSCNMLPRITQDGRQELLTIGFEARIPDTQANCTKYCTSQSSEAVGQCQSKCMSGSRKVIASATYSYTEIFPENTSQEPEVFSFFKELSFNSLSALIGTKGPDLKPVGDASRVEVQFISRSFPENSCAVVEKCIRGTGNRTLMKFTGIIQNVGDEDVTLGDPIASPLFQFSACHNHYHFKSAMKYELIMPDQMTLAKTTGGEEAVGQKAGFCMMDMNQFSGSGTPTYTCTNQGLTSGFSDVYNRDLDCQWIDVTDVAQGKYFLKITVNPDQYIFEADYSNNSVLVPVTVPPPPPVF